jgi:hypothetical protein
MYTRLFTNGFITGGADGKVKVWRIEFDRSYGKEGDVFK